MLAHRAPVRHHASSRPSPLARRTLVVVSAANKKKVVVLGGTGRVGSATASALLEDFGDVYDVAVAGRSRENYDKIVKLRPRLVGASYVPCDIADLESVKVRGWFCSPFERCLNRVRCVVEKIMMPTIDHDAARVEPSAGGTAIVVCGHRRRLRCCAPLLLLRACGCVGARAGNSRTCAAAPALCAHNTHEHTIQP
jgi:NADPH:quinone reductase-like Zn-dependent oxidoreductase